MKCALFKPSALGFALIGLALIMPASFSRAQRVTGVIDDSSSSPTTVIVQVQTKHRSTVWFRGESQHFIVYSHTSHADVASLLDKMEKFRYVLRVSSRLKDADDDMPKAEIYYLNEDHDLDTLDSHAPPYAIGLYKACDTGSHAYGVHMYYAD